MSRLHGVATTQFKLQAVGYKKTLDNVAFAKVYDFRLKS